MTVYRDPKRGTYRYHFQLDGKRFTKRGFPTMRAATTAEEKRRQWIVTTRSEPFPNFAELVKAFLAESIRTKSEAWAKQLTWKVTKGFKQWAEMHPREIRAAHVQRALQKLAEPKVIDGKLVKAMSPTTRNEYRKIIHAVFQFAWKLEVVDRNPVALIDREPQTASEPVPIPTDVLQALLTHASPQERRFLIVLALTGARWREIAWLRVEDVHLDDSQAVLRSRKNKQRSEALRRQFLPALAAQALAEQLPHAQGGWVFPSRIGGKRTYRAAAKSLYWLRKRAKVMTPYGYHAIRRWAATHAVTTGVSDKVVATFLGQKDTSATHRYIRVADDLMQQVGNHLVSELERPSGAVGSEVTDDSAE